MVDKTLRKKDILKLISKLDISPSMYKNATDKYEHVATYLQEKGIECDVFPQGSFSLGTVVRPYKESKEADYDLDFICCINKDKAQTNPEYIKNIVKEKLSESEIYSEKLQDTEWDKCWTLKYADIDGVGFNIDIVPGVPESKDIILSMVSPTLTQADANLAVAITNKREGDYNWVTSNPRAYKNWFARINQPFLENDRQNRRRALFESHQDVYNSIEEIPEGIERSSLQRVIQLLKHHRDIYYSRIRKEDFKPTSAIITTICAEIAQDLNPSYNVFELLEEVVKDFGIYAKNQTLTESQFRILYQTKNVILKQNGKWHISNPVNQYDNLVDSWDDETAKLFFEWVKVMKRDYLEALDVDDNTFVALLENNFGANYVSQSVDTNLYKTVTPTPIINTPKPWRG